MLDKKQLSKAKNQYNEHVGRCTRRTDKLGMQIEMRLTFEQWLDIWLSSGHYHERGRRKGQYCMSRKNDIGHYEIGNVFIQKHADNVRDNNQTAEWKQNQKNAMEKLSQTAEWREQQTLIGQKRAANPAWQEAHRLATQSDKWKENHKLGIANRAHNTEWKENLKTASQQRASNPTWRENNRIANQKKSSKQISCDGLIFPSRKDAAKHFSPEFNMTVGSAGNCLDRLMKSNPTKYFYL